MAGDYIDGDRPVPTEPSDSSSQPPVSEQSDHPSENQSDIFSDPGRAGQHSYAPVQYSQPGAWNGNVSMHSQPMMGGPAQGSFAPQHPVSNQGSAPVQGQPPTPRNQGQPRPDYRQNRIDRVAELLKHRYRRITNEANSSFLVDTFTGGVLPEDVNAIAKRIAVDYRGQYQAEVPKSDIARAFDHFVEVIVPWNKRVFFGRAGYDPEIRQRFIDAGPENCFVFEEGASFYRIFEGHPRIRPTQSRSLPVTTNIGNVHPSLVGTLFDSTILSRESELLLIAWMVLSWMPDRKQVMLELLGEPSKDLEDAQKLIKNVVDPATEGWQNELPNHIKQLERLAHSHYLLSFNQVEALSPTQQKHLFSLMRGKQIQWEWKGKKTDATITVQCPVMLNSLESVVTEPKLADSTLSIEIEDEGFHNNLRVQAPPEESAIVASLLLIFGQVNAQWATVGYDRRFDCHRGLADLCRVGVLVAQYLHQDVGAFWHQFHANQRGRREFELEESPVASAVARALADEPSGVLDLSVMEWQALLEDYRPEGISSDLWPTKSRGLGAKFKLIKPLLRDVGISLTSSGQRGPRRYWRAEMSASSPEEG